MTAVFARWLFPGDAPPVENVRLEIEAGRIATLESGVPVPAESRDIAIIPALINTHTHLEFSDLRRPIEPREDFPGWLRAVISSRRERTAPVSDAVQQGLAESTAGGASGIGEIATTAWPFLEEFVSRQPTRSESSELRVRVYREILGLREEGIEEQLAVARAFVERTEPDHRFDFGLSPHAPYSLHPRLFEELCNLAQTAKVPVAMHLAESLAEVQLLRENTGPMRTFLEEMGLYRQELFSRGTRPMDFLQRLVASPQGLIVHGNYLNDEEIEFLGRQSHLSLAYCPRTHAAMQPSPHPWKQMEEKGVRITIGTDSRASNPDLSMWEELRFLAGRHVDQPASRFLKWATSNAAEAFGWNDLGRLAPGRKAELRLVRLGPMTVNDPERGLFQGTLC